MVAVLEQNYDRLCELMDRNFAIRRELYGEDVVGASNIGKINIDIFNDVDVLLLNGIII